ncbi:hypothetical protein [Paenibacillus glycinis]|uniref:Uncharacterized protein n=1 Tax=Paenibacillus glycinis TaxID=2697035 RepID=A0ABW9XIB8_9BACL|nr:hypothetical protein [Paenibacillus glycinis]NBD22343.1 hypothetical protein [Paenibacillus glycinis]
MKLRLLLAGLGISAAFPWLVYFILLGMQAKFQTQTNDFQYHDSYFMVMHVGWTGYAICFLACFALFLIGYAAYSLTRKVKS